MKNTSCPDEAIKINSTVYAEETKQKNNHKQFHNDSSGHLRMRGMGLADIHFDDGN